MKEEDVKNAANIKEHFILNPAKVNAAVEAIKQLYKSKGYYNTQVKAETTFPSDEGAVVRFIIDEGEKIYIKEIAFEGNTTFDDDELVLAGLKAGARGFLLKDVSLEQLVDAIHTVAAGGLLVKPAQTQRLLSGLERMRNDFVSLEQPDPLTERETEILRLMAGGYSNREIANSLHITEGTIKNHVSNILSKLGVRDRTRAVRKAFVLKLV